MNSKCYVCGKPAKYVIEWYGVNQFGENPEVVDERSTCSNFDHIVQADYETLNREHPSLLERVIEAMNNNQFSSQHYCV